MKAKISDIFCVSLAKYARGEARQHNRGFIVIASLLILIVLTLVQLGMARSFWAEEIMGGNLREKTRAFNAAQTANRYAELWVTNNRGTGVVCGTAKSVSTKICTDAVSLDNSPSSSTVNVFKTWSDFSGSSASDYWSASRISLTGGADTYYKNPGYYIQFVNGSSDGQASYFKISAFGYGGNSNSVAVVQSVFQIHLKKNAVGNQVDNLGGL